MRIKICGLKDPDNAQRVCEVKPDYIGLIFYPPSPRFIDDSVAQSICRSALQNGVKSIGVFVNVEPEVILKKQAQIGFFGAQLHGENQMNTASTLRTLGFQGEIFAAISATQERVNTLPLHAPFDYLIFDTPSQSHGGSGRTFDWSILSSYRGIPFFLSGGIGLENIGEAFTINNPNMVGVDLNSKLETAPGYKDIALVTRCIEKARL